MLLRAKTVRVSGALKFRIASQLGTVKPEEKIEGELHMRWVNGNGALALGHLQESWNQRIIE